MYLCNGKFYSNKNKLLRHLWMWMMNREISLSSLSIKISVTILKLNTQVIHIFHAYSSKSNTSLFFWNNIETLLFLDTYMDCLPKMYIAWFVLLVSKHIFESLLICISDVPYCYCLCLQNIYLNHFSNAY